jgi:hypothetical protein
MCGAGARAQIRSNNIHTFRNQPCNTSTTSSMLHAASRDNLTPQDATCDDRSTRVLNLVLRVLDLY